MSASGAAMVFKTPLLEVDAQPNTKSHKFKVGIALIGGLGLVLLGVMAMTASSPTPDATSLIGMPTSLRTKMLPSQIARKLPGGGPFKELVIAGLEASSNRCDRDFSVQAQRIKTSMDTVMASMSPADKEVVVKTATAATTTAETYLKAGITAPMGFFDPAAFSTNAPEGRVLFLREAEVKHGRVCMLAFLGMAVGENYHPLFGGDIDIPAGKHFQLTGGDLFWVAAYVQFLAASFFEERRTSFPVLEGKFMSGLNPNDSEEVFAAKKGRIPGDLGFDPLGLKPKNEKDLITMQNKELNNGRLAMFAVLGVIGQELATGEKIFR